MKNFELIMFDLDGTLTDSARGILNSVEYALNRFDIKCPDREKLQAFIGPPLALSFQHYCGFDAKKAWQAVEYYREYYSEKGIYENSVYPGIKDLLEQLYSYKKILAVATSKPGYYSKIILEYFDLAKYFTLVAGSNLDGSRVKKEEIIAYVLKNIPGTNRKSAIMVGDRRHDIDGAVINGIDSVGVMYGYGSLQEMHEAGPTYMAETVADLAELLLV